MAEGAILLRFLNYRVKSIVLSGLIYFKLLLDTVAKHRKATSTLYKCNFRGKIIQNKQKTYGELGFVSATNCSAISTATLT